MRTIKQLQAARSKAVNAPDKHWDCSAEELMALHDAGDRDFDWARLPSYADLNHADLNHANLRGAKLNYAELYGADLNGADLTGAKLNGADLTFAKLIDTRLNGADLTGAKLNGADLNYAELNGAIGLLDPIDYMVSNFERTPDGYIVYKTFGSNFAPPEHWVIVPGSEITEVVNPSRSTDCGSGINVATRLWSGFGSNRLWKCLIRNEWLMGVVVPFQTNGVIRTGRLELIEEVEWEQQS